jgi:type IV secretion system protein VirB1
MVGAALTLAQMLHICAPDVGARTMTAIVSVESGGNPLSIHDNTLRRSFSPQDARQAVVWANQLLAMHHSVDLGLSQINNANLPRLRLSVTEAFDACSNLSAGSLILAADYRAAAQQFGPGQYALRSAIGAYNSGSLFAGYAYVDRILAAAGLGASQSTPMPDLQAAPLSARFATAARTRADNSPAAVDAPSTVNASAPVSLLAPAILPAAALLPAPVNVSTPVRVVAAKSRTVRRAYHDTAPILVTTGLPNARQTMPARAFVQDYTNGSAIMLRVTPPTVPPSQPQ